MTEYYYRQKGAVSSRVINLPFSFTSSAQKHISNIDADSAAAWRNKVITVLMTDSGSRVWYDKYGASLSTALVFENMPQAIAFIKEAATDALMRWLPEISVANILYNYDAATGTLAITVVYNLPDGTSDNVVLTRNAVTTAGDSLQVVWNG